MGRVIPGDARALKNPAMRTHLRTYFKWVQSPGPLSRAALALILGLPAAGATAPDPGPENIFASPAWDDGRAEFSVYEGRTNRYGQDRPTEAHGIVVKEDLLRESR